MLFSAIGRLAGRFTGAAGSLAAPDGGGRDGPRRDVAIPATLSLAGTEQDCLIRNISATGMTVVAPQVLVCIGHQVEIRCEQVGSVCGTVRWFERGTFGVQFPAPIARDAVYSAREPLPEGIQPRGGRARMKLPATAHFDDAHIRVVVGNISVGGLMLTSPVPLRPSQTLMVEFARMRPIGGHVRWTEEDRCGVMFTRLLPIATAEEIAARAGLPPAWLDDVRVAHRELED